MCKCALWKIGCLDRQNVLPVRTALLCSLASAKDYEETSLCLLCCPVISIKRLRQAHHFGSLLEGSSAFPAAAIPWLHWLQKATLNNLFNRFSARTSQWIMASFESCYWDRWSLKNWMEYFAGLVFWDPLGMQFWGCLKVGGPTSWNYRAYTFSSKRILQGKFLNYYFCSCDSWLNTPEQMKKPLLTWAGRVWAIEKYRSHPVLW